MSAKFNSKKNINTEFKALFIKFNNFTHTVEKFITNEKKEFAKIIKDFWIEHQISDLLKISFILTLILWLFFLIYFDASHSHVSFDQLGLMKGEVDKALHISKVQKEIIEIQTEKIQEMSGIIKHYRSGRYEVAVGLVVTTSFSVGFIAGFVTMLVIAAGGG